MGNQEIRDAYFDLAYKVLWEDMGLDYEYYDADGLFIFRNKNTGSYTYEEAESLEEAIERMCIRAQQALSEVLWDGLTWLDGDVLRS